MKKRISILLAALILVAAALPAQTFAATSINDPAVYYTPSSDYKSGDCILTATKLMVRRALIMQGKTWDNISNESLRGQATVAGLLLWSFTVDVNGVAFKVGHGTFSGKTTAERTAEIAALLAQHPEGVVVHGTNAAKTGMHGVLVTGVSDTIYAADSTNNQGSRNMGIQRWADTTMKDPVYATSYWYIISSGPGQSVEGSPTGKEVSKLRITSYKVPKKLKKGKGFTIKGKVKSNNKITEVAVEVLDANGNVVTSAYKAPNAKSYNIKKLSSKLKFKKLKKGKYTYKVTASDTLKKKTLLKRSFKVK